ncbi:MAG: carboxypeptidase-like regulatory domain-containing protein [Acidobacteriota bacterium]|nr:carboxypeptidase-like regulatory domain-containing protein [Acidobacteriota bacterium]
MPKRSAGVARRTLAVFAAVGVLTLGPLSPSSLAVETVGNVSIRGKIFILETGDPRPAAFVHAIHFDTKAMFSSRRTLRNGAYLIEGLPFGYYDLVVEFEDKLYLSNRSIEAEAGGKLEISLIIGSGQPRTTEWWSADPNRRISGLDRPADGVAWIVEGMPRSVAPGAIPSGSEAGTRRWLIPSIAAGGLLGLLALGGSSSNDPPASPSE